MNGPAGLLAFSFTNFLCKLMIVLKCLYVDIPIMDGGSQQATSLLFLRIAVKCFIYIFFFFFQPEKYNFFLSDMRFMQRLQSIDMVGNLHNFLVFFDMYSN